MLPHSTQRPPSRSKSLPCRQRIEGGVAQYPSHVARPQQLRLGGRCPSLSRSLRADVGRVGALRRCQAVVFFGTSPQSRATCEILRFLASTKAVLRHRYSL